MLAASLGAASVGVAATTAGATTPFLPRPFVAFGTLFVFGSNGPDTIALRVGADDTSVVRVDIGDDGTHEFTVNRSTFNRIAVLGFGADDRVRVDESQVTFTDQSPTFMFGGGGNDTLLGGAGNDTFFGNEGNDFVDGGRGADLAVLGSGDDRFQWDPGEGSDVVEGQSGLDAMTFNGAGGDENFDVSANGQRVRFFRDAGNITMDLNDVEQIDLDALGGRDTLTVNNMSGTDLTTLNSDLEATLGVGVGDGQPDTVTVNGTDGNDAVVVSGANGAATVTGLAATIHVTAADPTLDVLAVNSLGGDDNVDASGLDATAMKLSVDGGLANDRLVGGGGNETFLGGDGNDFVDGGRGADLALLGPGDDRFQWDPGEGSDVVEGQDGLDAMTFNGAGQDEIFDVSANGQRVRFFRNLGNIIMDLDDVERIDLAALGGIDTVRVHDMSGTDLTTLNGNLEGAPASGTGDGAVDTITVEGTNGDDAIVVSGASGSVTVAGLVATVNLTAAELADVLVIDTLAGNDTTDSSGLAPNTIVLTIL
jgi:Ca2+-binding RTX toxin-like protein